MITEKACSKCGVVKPVAELLSCFEIKSCHT